MDGLNTTATAVKVEKGIKVIVTPEFRGIVCECGCSDGKEFNQFISKTVSKDIKGHWSKGEKLYLRCNRCGALEDWAIFKEDSKKLVDPKKKQVKSKVKGRRKKTAIKAKLVDKTTEKVEKYYNKLKKSKSEQRREKVMATEKLKKKRKVGRPKKK